MSTKDLTGFTYTDRGGRTVTVLGIDPLLGPSHYLVERDDSAQGARWNARWGVRAELIEALFSAQEESKNVSP